MLERLHLALTPDKLGQPALGGELEVRPQRAEASDLEHLYRLADALDPAGAERLELEVAFDESLNTLPDYRRMASVGSGGSTRAVRRARGPRAGGRHDRRRRRRSRDSPARLFPFVGFPALSDRERDNDLTSAAAECDH
jgi:hypothetical protein